MPKEIQCWRCDKCQTIYVHKEDSEHCEKIHAAEENLEIAQVAAFKENERFPSMLLIQDRIWSGTVAEYQLISSGSVEDYYEKKEWGGDTEECDSSNWLGEVD